jgi:hypothetical protein
MRFNRSREHRTRAAMSARHPAVLGNARRAGTDPVTYLLERNEPFDLATAPTLPLPRLHGLGR